LFGGIGFVWLVTNCWFKWNPGNSMKRRTLLINMALAGPMFTFAHQCASTGARVRDRVFGRVPSLDVSRVHLLPGSPFYERQTLHRYGYLASFDPDKLLYDYRKVAGLPQPNGITEAHPGWDASWLRGHMAGHYLSGASRMAVATGDKEFRKKVNYMVAVLAMCQSALQQDGYLAAFPSSAFDHLERKSSDGGGVLVPYYIIHKIMAGLLDAYLYLDNEQALQIAMKMATYF
jgi:uncharacterized protein